MNTIARYALWAGIAVVVCGITYQYFLMSPNRELPLENRAIESGHHIAKTICGDCHAISGPAGVGPSFQDIADQPATTAIFLQAFFRSNHDNMPNFIISPADTEDVIAYILSLKQN
jgi:mono/diheme cytochrome c family protein